jgi:hypothetical protein
MVRIVVTRVYSRETQETASRHLTSLFLPWKILTVFLLFFPSSSSQHLLLHLLDRLDFCRQESHPCPKSNYAFAFNAMTITITRGRLFFRKKFSLSLYLSMQCDCFIMVCTKRLSSSFRVTVVSMVVILSYCVSLGSVSSAYLRKISLFEERKWKSSDIKQENDRKVDGRLVVNVASHVSREREDPAYLTLRSLSWQLS